MPWRVARRAARWENRRMNLRGILLSVPLFALACSSAGERPEARAVQASASPGSTAQAAPIAPRRAVAALQTRDRTAYIFAEQGAVKVTVRDQGGALVADAVTLEKLRTIDPFLYEACRNAVAKGGEPSGPYLDATLYLGL
jgi:hypothetical protein